MPRLYVSQQRLDLMYKRQLYNRSNSMGHFRNRRQMSRLPSLLLSCLRRHHLYFRCMLLKRDSSRKWTLLKMSVLLSWHQWDQLHIRSVLIIIHSLDRWNLYHRMRWILLPQWIWRWMHAVSLWSRLPNTKYWRSLWFLPRIYISKRRLK